MSRRGNNVYADAPAWRWLIIVTCTLAVLAPFAVEAKGTAKHAARPRGTKVDPVRTASAKKSVKVASRPSAGTRRRTPARAARAPRVVRQAEAARPAAHRFVDEHVHVRRGDTLDHILAMRGFSSEAARPWLAAADAVYDLRQVRARHGVTLRFDRVTRDLEGIRYEIDRDSLLVLERDGDEIEATVEALPYVREVRGIAGRISIGLREDTTAAGVPPSVAAALGDIFGWDLDVEHGLDPGDEFRVIYENLWEVGRGEPLVGQVIAAEIRTRGHRHTAVFFEDDQGGGYYRPDGTAVSRAFLRYPVEFTEISSEFSMNRFHPILHRDRPHLGVDLAAPQGTPVRAAADGVVRFSGWSGGLGRTVKLEHVGEVITTYGHLSEIAPSVHAGTEVERGQVIGWVGSSGLATGPHLHYEITRAGEHLDPMAVTSVLEPPVPDDLRRTFDRVRVPVVRELAQLQETETPVRLALSATVWRGE